MKVFIVLGECTECGGEPIAAFSSLDGARLEFPHTSIWEIELDSPVTKTKYGNKEPTTPIHRHY